MFVMTNSNAILTFPVAQGYTNRCFQALCPRYYRNVEDRKRQYFRYTEAINVKINNTIYVTLYNTVVSFHKLRKLNKIDIIRVSETLVCKWKQIYIQNRVPVHNNSVDEFVSAFTNTTDKTKQHRKLTTCQRQCHSIGKS